MAFKNLEKILKTISYIGRNPQCLTSDIKANLSIKSLNPPTAEEQDLYHLLRLLVKNDFLKKDTIINKRPGGPHFTLSLSEKSVEIINSMRSLFITDKLGGSSVKPRKFNLHEKVPDIGEEVGEILDDLFFDLFEELNLNLVENPNLKYKMHQLKSKVLERIINIL